MKLESAVMQRFMDIIQSQEELVNPLLNRHQVYRDMVYHRFFETLTNIYPILTEQLGDELEDLIVEFQKYGARSYLLSDMAFEFGEFLKSLKGQELPYLEDLLWLEYGELLLLKKEHRKECSAFSWESEYTLSDSFLFRELHYPVYRGDFESEGVYPLLLFYDCVQNGVYFEEITPFAYKMLELLQDNSIEESIAAVAEFFNVDLEALRDPVAQLMQSWCDKKILLFKE